MKKSKSRKKNIRTQDNNDGHVKIARMEAELKRNPTNNLTAARLAEMKARHKI